MDKKQIIQIINSHPEMTMKELKAQAFSAGVDEDIFLQAWRGSSRGAKEGTGLSLYSTGQLFILALSPYFLSLLFDLFPGVFVGCLFMAFNLSKLGDKKSAKFILSFGFISLFVISLAPLIPVIFPFAWFVIFLALLFNLISIIYFLYLLMRGNHRTVLNQHFLNGGKKKSWLFVLLVSFIITITSPVIFGFLSSISELLSAAFLCRGKDLC